MKLGARDAAAWLKAPPGTAPGTLIHGADAMRVALKRADLILRLIGPEGDDEMRLTRIAAASVKDAAPVVDAIKAQGFFGGARAVLLEDATNAQAPAAAAALADWREGDAHLVVTARALPPSSALRKTFEGHRAAGCVAVYDDPPDRAEIEAAIGRAKVGRVDAEGMAALVALAQEVGPGDLRQMLEKLALYMIGEDRAAGAEDVAAVAPATVEAGLDDLVAIVAEARAGEIGPMVRRLSGQGVAPVTICIGAARHFRALHRAACDPGGAGAGIGRLRPPVHGPRRDAMLRQAQSWGAAKLERALGVLFDTDLTLRSASRAPQMALVERSLVRLAMMGRR